jgi:hypothetical protein
MSESKETGSGELVELTPKTPAKSEAKESVERTDDPVRISARDGLDWAALAPGRGCHRQAY